PRHDPLDIPVNRGLAPVEGDRGDRRCGVVADAGKSAQCRALFGEYAVVPLDHSAGAGVKIAGTRVIAEPLPEWWELVERCGGQHANIRPTRHESVEIWSDTRYRRLLQHDLAEPDAVWVGPDPSGSAPWQVAAMTVVPAEKGGGIRHSSC